NTLKHLPQKKVWLSSTFILCSLFKIDIVLETQSRIQVVLLLLLLLWPQAIWGMLQAKCLLTLNRDELGPQNHYRLGELSIGGIISATKSRFRLLSFHTSPSRFTQSIHSIFSFLMKTNQRATNHGLSLPFYSAMRRFAEESFMCLYTKDTFSVKLWRQCREREELEALPKETMDQILSLDNYFIYNTIWAVTRILNAAFLSRSKRTKSKSDKNIETP
ncbi:hypothetical protein E2320_014268, partial [Naja naja]